MRNSFAFGLSRTFIIQLFIIVLNIVQSVVINRTLIPSDKGIYAVIMQSLNIFVAFLQFGQPEVMLHYFSIKKNNKNSYFANLSFMILISFLLGGVVILLLLYSKSEIINAIGHKEFLPFIFSFLLALNLLNIFYQRIIQLNGNLNNFNFIVLSQKIIWLCSIIISINMFENNLFSLVIGLLISLITSSIITVVILFKNKIIKMSLKIDFYLLKSSILDGFKIQTGLVATIIGTQLGVFILASQVDNESAGIYSVSLGLVNMLLVIPNSIKLVFQSRVSKYLDLNKGIEDQTIIIFKQTLIIMMFCSLILLIFGQNLILFLYGVAYASSYGPLSILLLYIIFRAAGSSFGTYFALEKKFWFGSKAVIITVIINILLSFLFSNSFGIYGVAMATSFSWFVWFIINITKYLNLTKTKIKYLIPNFRDIIILVSILKKQLKI